jgi:hypothetical protein
MQVSLNDGEVSALLTALDSYLPDLREEIGKTDDYDLREQLKAQEAALTGLIAKLGGSIADTNEPGLGASNPPWGSG